MPQKETALASHSSDAIPGAAGAATVTYTDGRVWFAVGAAKSAAPPAGWPPDEAVTQRRQGSLALLPACGAVHAAVPSVDLACTFLAPAMYLNLADSWGYVRHAGPGADWRGPVRCLPLSTSS